MTTYQIMSRALRAIRIVGNVGVGMVMALRLAGVPLAAAQEPTSGDLAKQLVTVMIERKLDAFAAQDPAKPGYFVAVRTYPGVQMLVVGAQSNSTDYIKYQIERHDYGEAYSALNASAVPETKVFLQDMGCDGLQTDEHVDVMYEKASSQVVFDRNGKASGLSKSAYAAKLTAADAHYRTMLEMLLSDLRRSSQLTGVR
jgi:hypothetical protein